jgi:hypothetical protein
MKCWESYVLWEGLPFLVLLLFFGSISAINWDYERKLLTPDNSASGWADVNIGPIMLAIAAGLALVASILLFIVRQIHGARPSSSLGWSVCIPFDIIAVFVTFASLCIVVLGPAGITMMEQMRAAPR